MNPDQVAESAVAVIVAYHVLAAGKEGAGDHPEGHGTGIIAAEAVYALVQETLAGQNKRTGSDAAEALDAVREQPATVSRRQALATLIEQRMSQDPGFARQLATLVETATGNTAVNQTILTIYGFDQAQSLGATH